MAGVQAANASTIIKALLVLSLQEVLAVPMLFGVPGLCVLSPNRHRHLFYIVALTI